MSGPDVRAIDPEVLPEESFPTVRQGFRVRIAEGAFDRATTRGAEEPDREIGGILVGRLRRDGGGPFVLVETTIDALHAEEKSTELTFTHETWAHVHEVMDAEHEGLEIVGWYHTHPGFGVFLSDRDVFIHRSFFNLPHQIALVYDPKSREHGLYTWTDGEPMRCRRYWVGEAEQVWDPAVGGEPDRPEQEDAGGEPGKRVTTSTRADEGIPLDRYSMGLIGIVLLVLGAAGGWWFAGGRLTAEAEKHRTALLAERLAGARDVIEKIDLRLIDLLRRSIDGESLVRLGEGVGALDRGLARLTSKDPPDEEMRRKTIEEFQLARRAIRTVLDVRLGAARALEEVARARHDLGDARQTRRDVALHGAALGRLCAGLAEMAAGEGEAERARSFLLLAVRVDPGGREGYEAKLREIGKKDE